MSTAEDLVRKKDAANRRLSDLEGYMRDLRLERGAGLEVRRISLLARVFGGGWTSASTYEEMPPGMEHEFYRFLGKKASKVADEVREYEKQLEALAGETK